MDPILTHSVFQNQTSADLIIHILHSSNWLIIRNGIHMIQCKLLSLRITKNNMFRWQSIHNRVSREQIQRQSESVISKQLLLITNNQLLIGCISNPHPLSDNSSTSESATRFTASYTLFLPPHPVTYNAMKQRQTETKHAVIMDNESASILRIRAMIHLSTYCNHSEP